MILKDIIEEVNSLIDHNPNVDAHRNHVVRLVNRHYESVCSQAPWRFLQRRARKTLYADVSGSATETITVTQNSDIVVGTASTVFGAHMEGQLFTGPDSVEMRIANVDEANNRLLLEGPYAGATGPSQSWSIAFDRIFLDKDCVDFLGITMRDEFSGGQTDRRIQYIDPRMEEEAILNLTESGDTVFVTDRESVEVDSQGLTLSTAANSTTSTLLVGNTYEYCATFEYFGVESAPSAVTTATPTSSTRSVLLQIAIPPVTFALFWRQNFYRRNATVNGGWWHIGTNEVDLTVGTPTSTFLDSGSPDDFGRPLYEQGPRSALAVWRRPGADADVEVRYHKRPHRLVGDTDAPEMPVQYHSILVYLALSDIYTQFGMGNLAQLYAARADEKIVAMRRKYLDRTDKIYRRKLFAGSGVGSGYLYQDPIKT